MQQYIGFHLNHSEYTIPITKVREIINMPSITKMPQSPPYIEGITNLRGNIIPVVNLKKLVNLGGDEEVWKQVIVIASGKITFGILVDDITGVINIEESDIEPPDRFLANNMEQVEGVAKLQDRLVVLLDPRKLIPFDDMSLFEDTVVEVKDSETAGKVEVMRTVQTLAGEVQVKEIHDAKEFFDKRGIDTNDPRYVVFDDMMNFMDAIGVQDYEKADIAIQNIMKKGQGDLFKEIGRVTRKMHDSVKSFKEALDPKLSGMANVEMPNAIDRLQFVIDKTEEAAHKTMGIVEKYMLSMDGLAAEIRKLKEPEDSVAYLKKFKNNLEDDLTELITTQSYQDITGQTIKKVIKLVGEIEKELVSLIASFGVKIDPGVKTPTAGHEQVSQTDVDDMLKDFGF